MIEKEEKKKGEECRRGYQQGFDEGWAKALKETVLEDKIK